MDQSATSKTHWSIKSEKRELLWLIVFTIIAGVLRFVSLDRPTVWGDEVSTYARISGTYAQLLELLSDRSLFTPLHYQMLWWIKQGMPMWGKAVDHDFVPSHQLISGGVVMTPFMLRLIPAITGTLLIPAFYFLSRQLFGPRRSLTVALLACFSAFLLVYSRDAKMYSPCWLFVVLNMAFFLRWLRCKTITSWLAWIFTGIVMIGLHAVAGAIVAVQLFFVLSSSGHYPLQWFRILMSPRGPHPWRAFRVPLLLIFAIGAAGIVTPAVCYYAYFDKHIQNVVGDDTTVDTSEAGVSWVDKYNDGRSLGDLVLYTTSTFMSGWEWPQVYDNPRVDNRGDADPRALKLLKTGNIAMVILLASGLIPWQKLRNPTRAAVQEFKQDQSVPNQFRHRRILWIVIWLCVFPYVVYFIAESKPVTVLDGVAQIALNKPPTVEWPRFLKKTPEMTVEDYVFQKYLWTSYLHQWPKAWDKYSSAFSRENLAVARLVTINAIALILTLIICLRVRWVGRGVLQVLIAGFAVIVICMIVSVVPKLVESSIWMPRYLGVVMPAFLLGASLLISQQPARWMRILTIGLFVVLNMGQFSFRVWGNTEPPVDRMARDLVNAQPQSIVPANPQKQQFRTYVQLGRAQGAPPGFGTLWNQSGNYYLWLYSRVNISPRELRQSQIQNMLNYWENLTNIRENLQSSPSVTRFSTWTIAPDDEADAPDKVIDQVKGTFRRESEQYFPCYDHWSWRKTFTVVRREYVKLN